MELSKETMKKIILIIAAGLLMLWAALNYEFVLSVLGWLMGLLHPLVLGFCIAFILNVIVRIFEDYAYRPLDRLNSRIWKALRRPLSVILSLCVVVGVVFFVVTMVVPELERAGKMLIEQFPGYWEQLQVMLNQLTTQLGVVQVELPKLEFNLDKVQAYIEQFLKSEMAGNVFNTAVGLTTSIFSSAFNFVLAVAFSIYMLLKKETLGRQAKQLAYAFFPRKAADEMVYVGTVSNHIFAKFITGQFTEAIIIGILCFIGMSIFHMPYAPMISVLVGFTALIPVFGAFIGTGIGAFLILMVEPIQALWFILFIIVLQQVEGNVIYPKVVGTSVGLPAIWVMLAVIIGGSTGGIMGMLVSVPISSVAYALLRRSTYHRLERKKLSAELAAEEALRRNGAMAAADKNRRQQSKKR